MNRSPSRCHSGAQTPRRCYFMGRAPRGCYSGAQIPRSCYSGCQTPRRCHTVGQTPRRCYSGAPLLFLVTLLAVCGAASEQLRYSIPEEMRKGSFVGNVALDLGMDIKELSEGGARIVSRGRKQYFTLSLNHGHLYVKERIDRENVCGRSFHCLINIEIFSEKSMKVYTVEVEIQDVNDNSPTFIAHQLSLQILENTAPGTRFLLPEAQDADEGNNSLQNYQLSANEHFTLDVNTKADGTKYAKLNLEKPLDREEHDLHQLILTATDGGDPVRSGTMQININVQDVNDNVPVFDQSVYKFTVREDAPKGSVVGNVRATDIDQASNAEVHYSFHKITDVALKTFTLNSTTGEISLTEELDFEESEFYDFEVQGSDASFSSRCHVLIEIININDNSPEILISSTLKQVSENSPSGTVIALLEIFDRDSGVNGVVTCFLPPFLPFQLQKSVGTYYSLVTDGALDREQFSQYNITITAIDGGTIPLSTTKTINLEITDENDNSPVFKQTSYYAYIMENLPPRTSIFVTKARDLDWEKNAKITYTLIDGYIGNDSLSSSIAINSESGVIYALQSFDFEKFKEFQIKVEAQDGGSPPLSNNVTVTFFILDQNDNTPEILYPSPPTDGSSGVEMAPRSSEPGYLITKVVAVDADSGQNSWLSYQLLRSTDQGLFTVGVHTGEIRTARPIMEKDAIKQFLVVSVKDNGQTPLSSSVTVTIVLADSLPEILHDISDPSAPADMESDPTLYLLIAVAVVSFLFLFLIILLLATRIHNWRKCQLRESSVVNFSSVPDSHFVGIDGVKAFLKLYSHDVCVTDTGRSQQMLHSSGDSKTLSGNQNNDNQAPLLVEDFLGICKDEHLIVPVSTICLLQFIECKSI
ncbi:protocadherin gamma-A6-like [Pleurodeles waltl]|uniref:protocadherin gamma-A6-like n=1 Tax=Pleurodeles waltl TaxID=8319 RepID=UPI0037093A2C